MSAISKSKALLRHKTIDACLRNSSRKYSLNDLILQCTRVLSKSLKFKEKISLRTLQADIEFMRDPVNGYGAPIEVYEKKYYRYSNPDFALANLSLNGNRSNSSDADNDDFPIDEHEDIKVLLGKLDAVISTDDYSYLKEKFVNLAAEYFAHENAIAAEKAAAEEAARKAEEEARRAAEEAARRAEERSMNYRSAKYSKKKKKDNGPDLFSDLF